MKIELKDFKEEDFLDFIKDFKIDTIKRVSDPTYQFFIHSFMFEKKQFEFMKYFSKKEDLINLFKFCEYTEVQDMKNFNFFWSKNHFIFDKLLLETVYISPRLFLKDKKLAKYARRFLIEELLNKDYFNSNYIKTCVIDNKVVNFCRYTHFERRYFMGDNFEVKNIISDDFLKEQIFYNKEDKILYGKDIINALIKAIKTGKYTYKTIDLNNLLNENLLNINEDMEYYYLEAKKVIETNSFLRKRKPINYKFVNKRTFNNFISNYFFYVLKNGDNDNLISFLRKNNLKFKDFRISNYKEMGYLLKNLTSFILGDNYFYTENTLERLKDKMLLIKSKESLLERHTILIKNRNEFLDISKFINPKKYSFKTKELLLKNVPDINILLNNSFTYQEKDNEILKSEFKLKFLNTIDQLIKLGISEKKIRSFFKKFILIDSYIIKSHKQDLVLYDIHKNLIHDCLETLLPNLNKFVHNKKIVDLKNSELLNSFFVLISKLNNDLHNVDLINKCLYKLNQSISELINHKNIKISSIQSFNSLITSLELTKITKEIEFFKKELLITEEGFNYSSKMDSTKRYLNLLGNILRHRKKEFFSENKLTYFPNIHTQKYSISITPHNDSIGLLGANVRGVCISSYGNHRLDQISPNFANLIVHSNEKGIFLWGLLCRAENKKGETIYILNNFQGTATKNHTDEIIEDIEKILLDFMIKNNIKNILFKNHGFNASPLKANFEEYISESEYKLNEEIRLDFTLSNSTFKKITNYQISKII